jgi:hypothetical protein
VAIRLRGPSLCERGGLQAGGAHGIDLLSDLRTSLSASGD